MKALAISAFDLDHTLLSGNSSFCLCRYLCHQNYLPRSALVFAYGCLLRHKVGLLSIEQLHEHAFRRLFQGRLQAVVKKWAEEFLDIHLQNLLYLPAMDRLKKSQQAGHLTALLSSSPDFLVEGIARRLDIPLWNATKYAVDKDQRFCHISQLMLGKDKAQILGQLQHMHGLDKLQTYAYSDSHLDLPFLQAAGHAVGVNPSRRLRSLCRQNQWPII